MALSNLETTIPALQTAYPAAPTFDWGFLAQVAVSLMSTAAGSELFISFDGATDDVHLKAGTPSVSYTTSSAYTKCWVRSAGVASDIQIVAETVRW